MENKKMTPIVRSLLETDLYKFTMWQALLHGHPNSLTEYEFVCRNTPQFPLAQLKEEVEQQLDHLCTMAFAEDELDYLRSLRFMKSDFVDFLTVFRFQRKFIRVDTDGDTLTIRAGGPQVHVMAFEIFVLYIVNELYFRRFDRAAALTEGRARLAEKIAALKAFGVRLRDFQKAALEDWVQEYRGDLGVALTDVVGMDAFLDDFDLYFAKLFDGLRHDSGDPVVWGEKALAHYAALRIDANTKRLVFSDGLNLETAFALYRHFADRIMVGFGIGTNLTNDVGLTPLNIVMKLMCCNGQSVAKLSDSPGKTMCRDETFLAYLRQVFHHPAQ